MEIRKIERPDMEAAVNLYALCMAENNDIKAAYKLRRDADRPELAAALALDRGPLLYRAAAYGTSLGAWEAGDLVGIHVAFWYKVVREHDLELFDGLFLDKSGNLGYGQAAHDGLSGLCGTVLYSLSLCVKPDKRRDRVATRLAETSVMRLKPDWVAADTSVQEALPIYERLGRAKLLPGGGLYAVECP